ncbi:hypothetical protein L9F63_021467, partial [Diploptera punctata]
EHFPFFKANDDRWKNSVRHNLSINPHFRKGCKASHGAGHLWTIANKEEFSHASLLMWAFKGRRKQRIKKQRMQQIMSNVITAEEVEAATASIEDNKENREFHREGVSLEQSAEEILSGVKKEVQVQYLSERDKSSRETDPGFLHYEIFAQSYNTSNFLNPVSKEVVVEESGLLEKSGDLGTSYLITDLNPVALGLNIGEAEVITPDNLFAEEIGFQYYELTSPPPQLHV